MREFELRKVWARPTVVAMILLAAAPKEALANAGTPLIWAQGLHLFAGNAIIGIAEGVIIAHIFKVKKSLSIGLMILANYSSTVIGALCVSHLADNAMNLSLYNAWRRVWIFVFLMYVVTIVCEWPFILLILRKVKSALRKSMIAGLLVQTFSYVFIFGWYWIASGTSLYTGMNIVQLSEMPFGQDVIVYFIGEDGDVYCMEAPDQTAARIFDLNSAHVNDRLLLEKSGEDPNRWRLVGRLDTPIREDPMRVTIQEGFSSEMVPHWPEADYERQLKCGTWFNFGRVPKLGQRQSGWEFWCGFWAGEGVSGKSTEKEKVHFSFETPFGAWSIRNATVLPDNKVIFQLGKDQICVLEPESKTVALIASGKGPVVILKETNERRTDGPS